MSPKGSIDLKFMLWNLENFFILSDQKLTNEHIKLDQAQWKRLSTSVYDNKPIEKIKKIAQVILEEDPDILMLCEVGGLESLNNFNELFLAGKYSPALIEGNSDRNIDVGFLIKKNLPCYFDLISNKNRPINYLYPHERLSLESGYAVKGLKSTSHKFSRDVAELHLFISSREEPFLVALMTHLKSQLDPEGVDPNGFERRQAELNTLIEIYSEIEKKFGEALPVLVCGDFNGNASVEKTDSEFKNIYSKTKLQDVLEISATPQPDRMTYFQVGRSSSNDSKQLDYAFLSPAAAKLLDSQSAKVYRFKDHLGMQLNPPKSLDEKLSLMSDHYPIVYCLKNIPLTPSLTGAKKQA